QAHPGAGAAQQRDVLVGQVGGVDRGGVGAEGAAFVEQLGGGSVVAGQAGFVLGALLGEVDVHGGGGVAGPCGDVRDVVGGDGAHRVDGGAEPGSLVAGVELLHAVHPVVDVAVAEANLDAAHGGGEAAGEVAGVEQGDPDAGV